MELIKRPLEVGERIICKINGRVQYKGQVIGLTKKKNVAYIDMETNIDGVMGNKKKWRVFQTFAKAWSGCFEREHEYSSYVWDSFRYTGRILNRGNSGYLYSDNISSWRKELGDTP